MANVSARDSWAELGRDDFPSLFTTVDEMIADLGGELPGDEISVACSCLAKPNASHIQCRMNWKKNIARWRRLSPEEVRAEGADESGGATPPA